MRVLATEIALKDEERSVGGRSLVDELILVVCGVTVVGGTVTPTVAATATIAVNVLRLIVVASAGARMRCAWGYYILAGHHRVKMCQGEHPAAHGSAVLSALADHPLCLLVGVFPQEHITHLGGIWVG